MFRVFSGNIFGRFAEKREKAMKMESLSSTICRKKWSGNRQWAPVDTSLNQNECSRRPRKAVDVQLGI